MINRVSGSEARRSWPWIERPYTFSSLLDMLKFSAFNFVRLNQGLAMARMILVLAKPGSDDEA